MGWYFGPRELFDLLICDRHMVFLNSLSAPRLPSPPASLTQDAMQLRPNLPLPLFYIWLGVALQYVTSTRPESPRNRTEQLTMTIDHGNQWIFRGRDQEELEERCGASDWRRAPMCVLVPYSTDSAADTRYRFTHRSRTRARNKSPYYGRGVHSSRLGPNRRRLYLNRS